MRAALMDARPCAVPSRICVGPAKKKCSVNFRPFSAHKERSEFGNEFRVLIKSRSSSHRLFFITEVWDGRAARLLRRVGVAWPCVKRMEEFFGHGTVSKNPSFLFALHIASNSATKYALNPNFRRQDAAAPCDRWKRSLHAGLPQIWP